MKELLITTTVLLGGLLLPVPSHAHGGQYRGPGDVVPPGAGGGGGAGGGAGPAGPAGPTGPGSGSATGRPGVPGQAGSGPGQPSTGAAGDAGPDLTEWTFWWEFNKDPYLDLKTRIRQGDSDSGVEGFFFGQSPGRSLKDAFRPSEPQIRNEVVPALVRALESETHNDIVTGCLIALAKIGDAPDEAGTSRFAPLLARSLASKTLEIRETAAVALGILAHRSGIELLEALVEGGAAGRALVGQSEVDVRTRTFAAYGLGLIGNRAQEADRARIVARLGRTLAAGAPRDLEVACVIALGLVPVATIESLAQPEKNGRVPPETSRLAQLDFLLALLVDRERDHLVRAHCPTALARLLADLPPELHAARRATIAEACLARLEPRAREQNEVLQGAVQALGLLGTNDDASALDRRIRLALARVEGDVSARNFALIALAKLGARTAPGAVDPEGGLAAVRSALVAELTDGKGQRRSWAALACGVLGHELRRPGNGAHGATLDALQRAVRHDLATESKNPSHLGSLAVAAGLLGDVESKPLLVERLRKERDEGARGYVALGLGLMNAREALEELEAVVAASKYLPDLLKQSAIALGLMGDKSAVPALIEQLESARGLATQAALSKALGFIGDRRSIEPLARMLANQDLTAGARGFAAVALGIVADKEDLPWNAKIALDLNYRAATPTLTSAAAGTGILDIL